MAGPLRKALRKIGGSMKKAIRTLAKPFKKVMGFMGRLGWVGTLAMMIAMPYISGFWGSMTEGISTWIGGTAAGGATATTAVTEATAAAVAEGATAEVAKQVGVKAGQAAAKKAATTVGEKVASRFASGVGEATGLFAKGPMAKALGYTLKSMQIGISGIGKVYSSLTDLVTAGVDFIAQPLMKEGMSFTDSMTNWVGDRFDEARNAMGLKTSKGYVPGKTKTAATSNANKVDFTTTDTTIKTTTPTVTKVSQETVDSFKKRLEALKASDITTASDLVEARQAISGIGIEDRSDFLAEEVSILSPGQTGARQRRIRGTDIDYDAIYDQGPMTKITSALDMPSILDQSIDTDIVAGVGVDDDWYFGKNIKDAWRGKYEQVPNYVTTGIDDDRLYLDEAGKPLPKGYKQVGYKDVYRKGIKDRFTLENMAQETGEFVVGKAEDYFDPQRLIQDKIDETLGLNEDEQKKVVESYVYPLDPLPQGSGILPNLPGMDFLSVANHTRNINNGEYYASPYNYTEKKEPYAFPGYISG